EIVPDQALRVDLFAQSAEGVIHDRGISESPVGVTHYQCLPLRCGPGCSVGVIRAIQVYESLVFGAIVYLPDVEYGAADNLNEQSADNMVPLSAFACPAVGVVALGDGASCHHPLCQAVAWGGY